MRIPPTHGPVDPARLSRRTHLVALALILPGVQAWADSGVAGKTGGASTQASRQNSQPAWKTLSPAQREALAPLAPIWGEISPARKRKWIALSANFQSMSAADKARLHGRMKEWASLGTAERNRARMQFAQTRELSPAEKKARWEAYQSLSPERKKQLAAQAGAPAPGVAPALTRNPSHKLAAVPTTRSGAAAGTAKP